MAWRNYLHLAIDLVRRVEQESEAVQKAAELVADSVIADGLIHTFGMGHSHLIAEEAFFRAGGLAAVGAILPPSLLVHAGATLSSRLEQVQGLAPILLDTYGVTPPDILFVISNSGVNVVPIEMAIEGKKRGISVIAITSTEASGALPPVHPSGKRLYEVADIVLNTHIPPGDAGVELPGTPVRLGPLSTIVGVAVLNAVMVEAAVIMERRGHHPPVYLSSHLPGAQDHNANLMARYWGRIRHL